LFERAPGDLELRERRALSRATPLAILHEQALALALVGELARALLEHGLRRAALCGGARRLLAPRQQRLRLLLVAHEQLAVVREQQPQRLHALEELAQVGGGEEQRDRAELAGAVERAGARPHRVLERAEALRDRGGLRLALHELGARLARAALRP